MIISSVEKDIVTAGSSDFREMQFGIKQQDISHIITLLREKMYKHPIQSICREVASNSRDANREVGRGDVPITIRIENNPFLDDQVCISFEDCGPGISPVRMQEIFMNYGASSKRGSNDQTGGFGLGAKSPFAYTKSFLINTNHGGTNYVYMAAVEDNNKGRMYLLEKNEDSISSDGTRIIIPIDKEDISYFEKCSLSCTCLWDVKPNYEGFEGYATKDCSVTCEEIQPGVTLARLQGHSISVLPPEKLNVLIDGIPYPLDNFSEEVGLLSKAFKMSLHTLDFAFLTFGVGDLSITPNRESLHYDDKTKNLILNRLREYKKRFNIEFGKYKRNMKFPFSMLAFDSNTAVTVERANYILKKEKDAKYLEDLKRDIGIKEVLEDSPRAHVCRNYEEIVKTLSIQKVTRGYRGLTTGGKKKLFCDKTNYSIDRYMITSLEEVGLPNVKSLIILMDRASSVRSKNVYIAENYNHVYEVSPSKKYSIEDAEESLKLLKLPYTKYSKINKADKEKNKGNVRAFPCRFRLPRYNCDTRYRYPVCTGTLVMDESSPNVVRVVESDYDNDIVYNIKDVVFQGVPYLKDSLDTYNDSVSLLGNVEMLRKGKSPTFLIILNKKNITKLKEEFNVREYEKPLLTKKELNDISVCLAYKDVVNKHPKIFNFLEKYKGSPFIGRYGRMVQEVKRLRKKIRDKDYEIYLRLQHAGMHRKGISYTLHKWLDKYRRELFKVYPLLSLAQYRGIGDACIDGHMSEYLDLINSKESKNG